MRKTREMPAEIVLSGHGEPITDHVALIDDRFAKHERRKEKIYSLIAEQPRSGYELAQAIWGNVAVTQAFLTLSEVIGHADLLVNEGRVREVEDGERDPLRAGCLAGLGDSVHRHTEPDAGQLLVGAPIIYQRSDDPQNQGVVAPLAGPGQGANAGAVLHHAFDLVIGELEEQPYRARRPVGDADREQLADDDLDGRERALVDGLSQRLEPRARLPRCLDGRKEQKPHAGGLPKIA